MKKEISSVTKIKDLFELKNAQDKMKENTEKALLIVEQFKKDMTYEEYTHLVKFIEHGLFNFNVLVEAYQTQLLSNKKRKK